MKSRKAKPSRRAKQPASLRAVPYPDKGTLATMNEERERLSIYLVEIATEATKTTRRRRRTCAISTVSKVFAGETKSQNILEAYGRLRKARLAQARNGAEAVAS